MHIRRASRADVPAIISIYSLDPLTGHRETVADPLPRFYFDAFDRIDSDPNQLLLVAELGSEVVGSLQATFIQHLISRGFRRAVIEALFVHPAHSARGIGTALICSAIRAAREAGCIALELTSNKARERAHSFYAKLGFVASHEGLKLSIRNTEQAHVGDGDSAGR